jgi:FlaA1/EpsC-like NDP-sugar epimerase
MESFFEDKVILITGAAGSVGQELVRQLLACSPKEIRAVDNNETAIFFLNETHRDSGKVTAYLGDVRDLTKIANLCSGVDYVFHTAALKHVSLSEYNPFDAVQTNILGVQNIIQAALHRHVKKVIFTSSDKAVNPTNVMGTSKLMGERLMTAANNVSANGRQVFASVRFGNVIGSRGSVVPVFAEQIRRGGPVTITDANMTRFFMTMPQSVRLVMESCVLACGGEVFVTKMPVMRILDLAHAMINLLAPVYGHAPEDITMEFIGARGGEKLYEELLTLEELGRTQEMERMFVILPAMGSFYRKITYSYHHQVPTGKISRPYISSKENKLSVPETMNFLMRHGVLDDLELPGVKVGTFFPSQHFRAGRTCAKPRFSNPIGVSRKPFLETGIAVIPGNGNGLRTKATNDAKTISS